MSEDSKRYYRTLLLSPEWQKKRLLILNRDKFTCQLCGDTRTTLNVHHESYKGKPWQIPDEQLKTLCEHCHSVVTQLKDYSVNKIHKHISLNTNCWQIVAYTDKGCVFLYLFFTTNVIELITVLPNSKSLA